MRFNLQSIVMSACLYGSCFAQTPHPVANYRLHAEKEPHTWNLIDPAPRSSVLATTQTGALLVLIPQPDRKWVLKELTDWSTSSPQEQSVALGADVWRDEGAWIVGDLMVTRDDRYAVVRITHSRQSSKGHALEVEASVILVDLNKFGVIFRRTTTDPLIAGAHWSLTDDNLLISNALTKRSHLGDQKGATIIDDYEAAILNLPDTKSSAFCNYTKTLELHGGTGWQTEVEKTADLKCADVLRAAKVSSVSDLPGNNTLARLPNDLHAPPSCSMTKEITDDGRFVLYDCYEGHQIWDWEVPTLRSLLVLSTARRTSVISVPLKVKPYTEAILERAQDQQYLILVRDGIQVEAYRLPLTPQTIGK